MHGTANHSTVFTLLSSGFHNRSDTTGCQREHPRFNTTCFSADQTQNRATVIGDSNISGPAPNTGISLCVMHHREGQNLIKGRKFQSPQPKRPLEGSHRHFSRFTVGGP